MGCYPIYNSVAVILPLWSHPHRPSDLPFKTVRAVAGDPSAQTFHLLWYSHLQRTTSKDVSWSPQLILLWGLSSQQPLSLCNFVSVKKPQVIQLKSQGLEEGNTMKCSIGFGAHGNLGSKMIIVQRPQNLGLRNIMVQLNYESNCSL